jgi:hypothetical protein
MGKKQLDWPATNTDVTTSQSHSLFAFSRENNRNWKTGLNSYLEVDFPFSSLKMKTAQLIQDLFS